MEQLSDKKMLSILAAAWEKYNGDVSVFASAAGALYIGRALGWQALRLIHPRSFKRYEEILGIRFREILPDRGPEAETVNAVRLADKIGRFWSVVAGGMVSGREARIRRVSDGGAS